MSNIINWDQTLRQRVKDDGARDGGNTPGIGYQSEPTWQIKFVVADRDASTITAIDVSDAVSWDANIDDDFDEASQVMVKTLNADIDTSQASSGIISVPLDADTSTFNSALGTAAKKDVYFELNGYNASGKKIYNALFTITAYNSIDPTGVSPEPEGSYYNKTESDARYNRKEISSQITLTDDATTNISLGSASSHFCFRGCLILVDSMSNMYIDFIVNVIGTTAYYTQLLSTYDDAFILNGTVYIDVDYNSGSPQLAITLASHGEDIECMYEIEKLVKNATTS